MLALIDVLIFVGTVCSVGDKGAGALGPPWPMRRRWATIASPRSRPDSPARVAHTADLIAFIQALHAKGDCQAQYGGFCDADGHDTEDLLVWRRESMGEGGTLSA
jgi:hypothetical protein